MCRLFPKEAFLLLSLSLAFPVADLISCAHLSMKIRICDDCFGFAREGLLIKPKSVSGVRIESYRRTLSLPEIPCRPAKALVALIVYDHHKCSDKNHTHGD